MSTSILVVFVSQFEKEVKVPVDEKTASKWFMENSGDISLLQRFIKNLKRKRYVV